VFDALHAGCVSYPHANLPSAARLLLYLRAGVWVTESSLAALGATRVGFNLCARLIPKVQSRWFHESG
jgi:hypothetical protein